MSSNISLSESQSKLIRNLLLKRRFNLDYEIKRRQELLKRRFDLDYKRRMELLRQRAIRDAWVFVKRKKSIIETVNWKQEGF